MANNSPLRKKMGRFDYDDKQLLKDAKILIDDDQNLEDADDGLLEEVKLLTKAYDDLVLEEEEEEAVDDDLLIEDARRLTEADFVSKEIKDEYELTDKIKRLNFDEACQLLSGMIDALEDGDVELPNLDSDNTVFSSSTLRIVRKVSKTNRGMRTLVKASRDFLKYLVKHLMSNLDYLKLNKSHGHMYIRTLYYGLHNDLPEIEFSVDKVKDCIDELCCLFKCDRESLGVTASDINSSFVGPIIVYRQDVSGSNRKLVKEDASDLTTPYRINFSNIKYIRPSKVPPRCILVVEKLTVFSALCSLGIHRKLPCVIISGSGQPSVECRLFVKLVHKSLPDVPIFAFVDYNPFGIDIFKSYKYGSMRLAFMSRDLVVASIRLIGLFYSDISDFGIEHKLRPLSNYDSNRLKNMITEEWLEYEPEAFKSLKKIRETRMKADIEILAKKLGYQGWVEKIEERIISILDSYT